MTPKYKTGYYKISNISLDPTNFRHPEVQNDVQAMFHLLSDNKKHKVLELARDIVSQGMLDPSSRLIIQPDPKNKNRYVVLEGNRRITALKVLTSPNLAPEASRTEFKKLSKDFLRAPITEVECVELNPVEAKIWIKRKHYKGMGGAGTLRWDAIATARSDRADGDFAKSKWFAVIKFIEEQGHDVEEIFEDIAGKTTTAERVLSSKAMKEELGVTITKDGKISFENDDNKAGGKLLLELMTLMRHPSFVETKVSDSGQQKVFLNQLHSLSMKKNKSIEVPSSAQAISANPRKSVIKPVKLPQRKDRKFLAEKGLDIKHVELNNFYYELTRLPVETYTHCAAGMIRIFLEKATMVFLDEVKVPHPGKKKWDDVGIRLRDKVKAVLQIIDHKKVDKLLNPAWDIANGHKEKVHTLDILNEYIHAHKTLSAPSELITAWDRLHHYFNTIFEYINEKKKP